MIIVLEGCDGSGKTTLANTLHELAEGAGMTSEIWHRGVPTRHPLEEYTYDIEEGYDGHRADTNHLLICDRWHHGQEVYGGLYRDSNELGIGGSFYVDQFLEARGAMQILLAPPDDVLAARVAGRGDDYIDPADIGKINEAYRTIARRYGSPLILLDDPEPLSVSRAAQLITSAAGMQQQALPLTAFPSYVGPPRPMMLLVGEKRNVGNTTHGRRAKRKTHKAAFVPYGGTSGQWLCDTIVSTQLATYEVGMTNALEEDVPALIEALSRPGDYLDVVALGKAAHEHLEKHYITHGMVPHPQYMRRFRKLDREKYAAAILEAGQNHYEVKP